MGGAGEVLADGPALPLPRLRVVPQPEHLRFQARKCRF